jgi:hypothetical protein
MAFLVVYTSPEATESAGQELLPNSALMNGQGCRIEYFLKSSLAKNLKPLYITNHN